MLTMSTMSSLNISISIMCDKHNTSDISITHSTHSILGVPLGEHKAPTNFFHSDQSWAISSSMVLRQVPSGLPRCLFPGAPTTAPCADAGLSSCEGHGQATSTVFFSPPERCQLFTPVRLQISSLHTFSCHLTFNILRKHLPSKPRSLLSNFLLVLHVSEA